MAQIRASENLGFLRIFISIITLFIYPSNGYAQKRICEIKYGERINEKRLEKKYFQSDLPESIIKKYGFDCYQIGVEHDSLKTPLPKKPIYACCSNYNPFNSGPINNEIAE